MGGLCFGEYAEIESGSEEMCGSCRSLSGVFQTIGGVEWRDAWASEAGQFRGSEDVFWIANVEAVGNVRTGGVVGYSNP